MTNVKPDIKVLLITKKLDNKTANVLTAPNAMDLAFLPLQTQKPNLQNYAATPLTPKLSETIVLLFLLFKALIKMSDFLLSKIP